MGSGMTTSVHFTLGNQMVAQFTEMEKTEKSRLGHKLWEWQSLVFDGEVSVEYEYKNLKMAGFL